VLLKLEKKKNHVTNNIKTENSSLCLIKHHATKIQGEVQVQPPLILNTCTTWM